MPSLTSSISSQPGSALCGKLPARPDFVRFGAFGPPARAFDAWLTRSMERVQVKRAKLPQQPLRFLFSFDGSASLLGVIAPSHDKVGRSYPVAIFRELASGSVNGRSAVVPEALAPLLREAQTAVDALPGVAADQVDVLLQRLDATPATSLAAAHALFSEGLQSADAGSFLRSAFGASASPMLGYALVTLLRAADSARGFGFGTRSPVIDFPVAPGAPASIWLELAASLVPGVGASFIWTEPTSDQTPARLLFRWGPPSDETLCALADARYSSQAVWPLTTDHAAALEQARVLLAGPLVELGQTGVSIARLREILRSINL